MTETILLLWGKNDDGQLGNRLSSCGSPTHARSQSRGPQPTEDGGQPTMMSAFRPAFVDHRGGGDSAAPPARGVTRSATAGGSFNDAFAWSAAPSRALSGLVVLQVSCGSRHTLARVEGGAAYSWGWGACGQLGHGDDYGSVVPREIEALKPAADNVSGGPVAWVSAGGIHSAAVLEGGRVFTWGGSSYGQLGLGPAVTTKGMQALPGKVMLSETESPTGSPRADGGSTGLTRHSSMTQKAAVLAMESAPKIELLAEVVVCGGMHTAALTSEGVVYCWGRADSGQLGIGAEWVHETSSGVMGVEWPRRVRGLLEGRKTSSIACGGFHTAAVTTDGECYTWGKEDYGMLGCSNEALLQGGLFRPHRVTLQAPANTSDGGDAKPSQEADGADKDHGWPQQKVKAVACGGWHTAVIGEKGGVWTCGRGEYGRLGLGDQRSQWQLTPVPLERNRAVSSSSARAGSIWETTSGKAASQAATATDFGVEADGPTSDAAVAPPRPPPTASTSAGTGEGGSEVRTTDPASMVALGGSHSLVMTASGRVFSFGRQEDGRLGVEPTEAEEIDVGNPIPEEIPALQLDGWEVKSISAGGVHSAAILSRQA